MSTKTDASRCRWTSILVCLALGWPSVAAAGPAGATEKSQTPAVTRGATQADPEVPTSSEPPAGASPDAPAAGAHREAPQRTGEPPETIEQAVEVGDLATAAELAREARQADPSPANWHREGEILERLGDYQGAAAAYRAEIDALPEDAQAARRAARADLERVRDASRGTVPDEPASQRRAELDERWAPTPKAAPAPKPKPQPQPVAPPDEKIYRKWYFWVTVIAITASVAAVTGIAIKASRNERDDALDLQRMPGVQGPAIFRF